MAEAEIHCGAPEPHMPHHLPPMYGMAGGRCDGLPPRRQVPLPTDDPTDPTGSTEPTTPSNPTTPGRGSRRACGVGSPHPSHVYSLARVEHPLLCPGVPALERCPVEDPHPSHVIHPECLLRTAEAPEVRCLGVAPPRRPDPDPEALALALAAACGIPETVPVSKVVLTLEYDCPPLVEVTVPTMAVGSEEVIDLVRRFRFVESLASVVEHHQARLSPEDVEAMRAAWEARLVDPPLPPEVDGS